MSSQGSSLGFSSTAAEVAEANKANIEGKVFVITGAYSGIGLEAAKALLKVGGKVVIGGRSGKVLEDTVESLKKDGYDGAKIDGGCTIDLADLESVKAFASYVKGKYTRIVLICNAGVMATPPAVTKQGFEQQFGINVVGHFLLAKLLVEITSRQVWLSSSEYLRFGSPRIDIEAIKKFSLDDTKNYDGWMGYQQSKLGDLLLSKEFHKRYPKLEAASLHPGAVMTNLGRHLTVKDYIHFFTIGLPRVMYMEGRFYPFKSAEQGAATTVTVASTGGLVNGAYYRNCEPDSYESESAKNEDDAKALFDFCDDVTKKFQ